MLSRVRLGYLNTEDIVNLNARKLELKEDSVSGKIKEVVNALCSLPSVTVCILPKRHMCDELNTHMLNSLSGEEIRLVAIDTVDCPVHLRQQVSKKNSLLIVKTALLQQV